MQERFRKRTATGLALPETWFANRTGVVGRGKFGEICALGAVRRAAALDVECATISIRVVVRNARTLGAVGEMNDCSRWYGYCCDGQLIPVLSCGRRRGFEIEGAEVENRSHARRGWLGLRYGCEGVRRTLQSEPGPALVRNRRVEDDRSVVWVGNVECVVRTLIIAGVGASNGIVEAIEYVRAAGAVAVETEDRF